MDGFKRSFDDGGGLFNDFELSSPRPPPTDPPDPFAPGFNDFPLSFDDPFYDFGRLNDWILDPSSVRARDDGIEPVPMHADGKEVERPYGSVAKVEESGFPAERCGETSSWRSFPDGRDLKMFRDGISEATQGIGIGGQCPDGYEVEISGNEINGGTHQGNGLENAFRFDEALADMRMPELDFEIDDDMLAALRSSVDEQIASFFSVDCNGISMDAAVGEGDGRQELVKPEEHCYDVSAVSVPNTVAKLERNGNEKSYVESREIASGKGEGSSKSNDIRDSASSRGKEKEERDDNEKMRNDDELEEGEIRESDGAEIVFCGYKEERAIEGPSTSKNKGKVLPPVNVALESHHQKAMHVGMISSVPDEVEFSDVKETEHKNLLQMIKRGNNNWEQGYWQSAGQNNTQVIEGFQKNAQPSAPPPARVGPARPIGVNLQFVPGQVQKLPFPVNFGSCSSSSHALAQIGTGGLPNSQMLQTAAFPGGPPQHFWLQTNAVKSNGIPSQQQYIPSGYTMNAMQHQQQLNHHHPHQRYPVFSRDNPYQSQSNPTQMQLPIVAAHHGIPAGSTPGAMGLGYGMAFQNQGHQEHPFGATSDQQGSSNGQRLESIVQGGISVPHQYSHAMKTNHVRTWPHHFGGLNRQGDSRTGLLLPSTAQGGFNVSQQSNNGMASSQGIKQPHCFGGMGEQGNSSIGQLLPSTAQGGFNVSQQSNNGMASIGNSSIGQLLPSTAQGGFNVSQQSNNGMASILGSRPPHCFGGMGEKGNSSIGQQLLPSAAQGGFSVSRQSNNGMASSQGRWPHCLGGMGEQGNSSIGQLPPSTVQGGSSASSNLGKRWPPRGHGHSKRGRRQSG